VYLNPGETKRVMVTLDARAFSYYDDRNHRWTAEPGEFDILVGRSAAQIDLTGKLALQNPK
jgi:beta-glucosidase